VRIRPRDGIPPLPPYPPPLFSPRYKMQLHRPCRDVTGNERATATSIYPSNLSPRANYHAHPHPRIDSRRGIARSREEGEGSVDEGAAGSWPRTRTRH